MRMLLRNRRAINDLLEGSLYEEMEERPLYLWEEVKRVLLSFAILVWNDVYI
jgi:hypothetical protein